MNNNTLNLNNTLNPKNTLKLNNTLNPNNTSNPNKPVNLNNMEALNNMEIQDKQSSKAELSLYIIVATDGAGGISKNGIIPWNCPEDLKYFKAKTTKYPNTAVILGRVTFESICKAYPSSPPNKVLPGRIKLIITSQAETSDSTDTYGGECKNSEGKSCDKSNSKEECCGENKDENKSCNKDECGGNKDENTTKITEKLFKFKTFDEAIRWCSFKKISHVYACGGERIYEEANIHPLLRKVYKTQITNEDLSCDKFYNLPPSNLISIDAYRYLRVKSPIDDFQVRNFSDDISPEVRIYKVVNSWENEYLKVLQDVLRFGTLRPNRTGISAYSLFSKSLEYPLGLFVNDGMDYVKIIPLLTTKRIFFNTCYKELLWFLAGGTNAKPLQAQNVHIWDGNSSREFLDSRNLPHYKEGQLGPVYGAQWRHFGGIYDAETDTMTKGVDQISQLISQLKTDPYSRRHVLTAWNPVDLDKMALPPCHMMAIFHVTGTQPSLFLNCKVIIRSNDMFLGHPFNVASYALLTHMIAAVCGMEALKLVIDITDCHIYENHVEQVKEQIQRIPYGFPSFEFDDNITKKINDSQLTIEDFKPNSILLKNYVCWPAIKGEMAK